METKESKNRHTGDADEQTELFFQYVAQIVTINEHQG
jgi:hypothetical protein